VFWSRAKIAAHKRSGKCAGLSESDFTLWKNFSTASSKRLIGALSVNEDGSEVSGSVNGTGASGSEAGIALKRQRVASSFVDQLTPGL